MTEVQRHILERHLQAARTQEGMSVEASWALLERKIASGPSQASRHFGFLGALVIVALLLLLGATYLVVMQPASTAQTDRRRTASDAANAPTRDAPTVDPRHRMAQYDTSVSAGDTSDGSRTASRAAGFRSSILDRDESGESSNVRMRSGAGSRATPPVKPRASSIAPPPMGPLVIESESADSVLSLAAEAFWHRELERYRAAFDRMLSAEDRDSLEALRMRFERVGQELVIKWSAGRPFDTAAAHDEVMEIYMGLGRMAPRYPAIVNDYRDSLVAAFRAFGATLESTASARRALTQSNDDASIAYDTLLARIGRMRADLETILANEEQVRNMYGMGMLPTILLYHGEELSSVLEKFESTMAVFVETPETSELVGFGALPDRAVIAPTRARGETASVEIALPHAAADVELRIVDARGDVVARTSLGRRTAGAHRETIPIGTLGAGEYLLVVDAGYTDVAPVYTTTLSIER